MPIIKHQHTKTLHIRSNDRSADFVTPNFIYGCAGGCRNSYCYVMRYNYEHIFINDNLGQILDAIDQHAASLAFPKPPNQVDSRYWVYDIGCSTDISLHWKHYDWEKVFNFFRAHPKIKATFATKYVNKALLDYKPQGKIRIRFSLMPEDLSTLLEPKTSLIRERINAIDLFIKAGYEVHLNFSPIIVYETWLEDYRNLFQMLNAAVAHEYQTYVKAECIFLTHNPWQHERNLKNNRELAEHYLWQPKVQERKTSAYGSEALRYKVGLKHKWIKAWLAVHEEVIPWNTIRYIF